MTLYQWVEVAEPSQWNSTVTMSNALVAGDVYLVIDLGVYDNTTQHVTALSGLGVSSWTRLASAQTQFGDVWIGQGGSNLGSGQVLTVTAPLLTAVYGYRRIMVYCFRGVTTTASAVVATANSATATTADATIDAGQVAVAFGISDTAADSLKNLVPGSGWATISTFGIWSTTIFGARSHREPATSEVHRASSSRTSGLNSVHLVTLGDAAAPPLTSSFVGWGNPIF